MKHTLARSATRALFNSAARHQHGGGACGSLFWRRMSTLPEVKDHQSEEKKNEVNRNDNSNNAVVPSYWGITRPKIRREDGTEWPWNCFSVRIIYSFIETKIKMIYFRVHGFEFQLN